MDKPVFLHRVNGLRASRWAGQTLLLACTVFVQIRRACESRPFCTFLPVDIHGLVHSWRRQVDQHRLAEPACWRAERVLRPGPACRRRAGRDVQLSVNSRARNENFFFERAARSTSGLQPKSVYKDSSSVNNCPFLWISRLTDEKSSVYARYKPVICPCMFLVANLDNNRERGKSRVFSQSVPVDIKKLIHSGASGAAFTIW